MQGVVAGIELERLAEFVHIRIPLGKLFAGQLGGAGFAPARGGKKRGHHTFGVAAGLLHAREFEQDRFAGGQKLERRFVVRGGEIEFIALLGELGKLVQRAEGGRRCGENVLPARDPGGERRVDIAERLRRGGAGDRVVRIADAGEDAAGFGFAGGSVVAGFEAEKGVFEGEMQVGWFEPHGVAELLPRGFAVAGLQ